MLYLLQVNIPLIITIANTDNINNNDNVNHINKTDS